MDLCLIGLDEDDLREGRRTIYEIRFIQYFIKMRKTLLFLLLFIIFGSATAWYLLSNSDENTSNVGDDRRFKLENTDDIYKIFIADRRGERTTLERKNGFWLYNGKYTAHPNAVENVLDAMRRVEMQYQPPKAAVQNMIKSLAADGIKVEIYNKNNNLLKSYYIGGSTPDERGTYMILEGAEQPYVAHLPGWEGNLRFRFNLKGDNWRDKTIFAEHLQDIQSVWVEYSKNKNKSFRLQKEGNNYTILPFYDVTPVIQRPYKKGSAEQYLEGFRSLGAEAFENDNPKRDSIQQLTPFSIITLKNTKGEEKTMRMFPIFSESDRMERYFAAVSTGDFMLVQQLVFGKVMRGYDFFFEEEIGSRVQKFEVQK